MLPTKDHLRTKDIHRLKVKEWKKYSMQMDMKKKAGVEIHISEKIDFKTKAIIRDKEGHYIGIVPRRYNPCKPIHTQHRGT